VKTFSVYALKCPDTGAIRYIGKTCDVRRRYNCHTSQKSKDHRGYWVGSLKAKGKKPVLQVLASGITYDQANSLEIFLIALLRLAGAVLVNGTHGGEGCSGFKHSKEQVERMRLRNKGNKYGTRLRHDQAFKDRLAARNRKRVWSSSSKAKARASHLGLKHPYRGAKNHPEFTFVLQK